MDLFVWELVNETTHQLTLETARDGRAAGDHAHPWEAA
jgi:hypothetical protein